MQLRRILPHSKCRQPSTALGRHPVATLPPRDSRKAATVSWGKTTPPTALNTAGGINHGTAASLDPTAPAYYPPDGRASSPSEVHQAYPPPPQQWIRTQQLEAASFSTGGVPPAATQQSTGAYPAETSYGGAYAGHAAYQYGGASGGGGGGGGGGQGGYYAGYPTPVSLPVPPTFAGAQPGADGGAACQGVPPHGYRFGGSTYPAHPGVNPDGNCGNYGTAESSYSAAGASRAPDGSIPYPTDFQQALAPPPQKWMSTRQSGVPPVAHGGAPATGYEYAPVAYAGGADAGQGMASTTAVVHQGEIYPPPPAHNAPAASDAGGPDISGTAAPVPEVCDQSSPSTARLKTGG